MLSTSGFSVCLLPFDASNLVGRRWFDSVPHVHFTPNPLEDSSFSYLVLFNGTNGHIFCDGGCFGNDLNRESCLDAWKSIPTDIKLIIQDTWTQGHSTAPLSVRFLSRKSPPYRHAPSSRLKILSRSASLQIAVDKLCAIEINPNRASVWDKATNVGFHDRERIPEYLRTVRITVTIPEVNRGLRIRCLLVEDQI